MLYNYYGNDFIILIPALILSIYAQIKVSFTFNEYSKIVSHGGRTGAEVARILLDSYGLYDIPVELTRGKLTDHYDPVKRTMRLSYDVFYGNSIASIGVAAHETGHAIQHKEKYTPLKIRFAVYSVAAFGSNASWIVFFLGMVLGLKPLVDLGIILFSLVVIFQVITLPVEFNASNRALSVLENKTLLYGDELKGAKKVLSAAALTYVAAALTSILQLVRLILIRNERD